MNQPDVTCSATSVNKELTVCPISANLVVYPSCPRTEISASESKESGHIILTFWERAERERKRARETYTQRVRKLKNKASKERNGARDKKETQGKRKEVKEKKRNKRKAKRNE